MLAPVARAAPIVPRSAQTTCNGFKLNCEGENVEPSSG